MRVQFSFPVRAFLRAVVSNEPIFQIAPPVICDILILLSEERWSANHNDCQQLISFYGSIIYNLIVCSQRCAFTLPESFWSLIRELGSISKGILFKKKTFFN